MDEFIHLILYLLGGTHYSTQLNSTSMKPSIAVYVLVWAEILLENHDFPRQCKHGWWWFKQELSRTTQLQLFPLFVIIRKKISLLFFAVSKFLVGWYWWGSKYDVHTYAYGAFSQGISIFNYWKDPYNYQQYLRDNRFLPLLENEVRRSFHSGILLVFFLFW